MTVVADNNADYKTELERHGAIAFVPRGNSMWPTLKNRGQSVIVVKKTGRLSSMDVALYTRADGRFVLHRVMEPVSGGYVMCGDSQFVTEYVKEEQVFGVMSGFYRGKKFTECTDEKYLRRSENWYRRKIARKFRIKFFYFRQRVKGFVRRIFRKSEVKEDV